MLTKLFDLLVIRRKLKFNKGATMVVTSSTGTESTVDMTELGVLDVTPGTATASKAVVLGASKDIATITSATITTLTSPTVNATNIDAGASGAAGSVDVFPTTASKGKLTITKADNTNNDATTLTVDLHGQATTVHLPDGGAAASYLVQSTAALALTEVDVLQDVTAGTSSPSKALVLDSAESLVWATTDSTASETVTLSIQDTRTGAGATGWTHKSELVSNVQLGSYSNAMYGLVTFGASGSVTGLSAGICGEVELSAGTTAGTYAAIEAELTANAAVSTGTDTAFIYGNIAGSNGTGKTTINTNAHLMVLGTGVVDTTSGLWDAISSQAVTASGRLRIKIGATLYYIPVCASAALTS